MERAHRITVREASKILDLSPETIRLGMRENVLPIGSVIKNERDYSYLIYEEKIRQYLYGGVNPDTEELLDKIIDYIEGLKFC